jgi:hypothetical protein
LVFNLAGVVEGEVTPRATLALIIPNTRRIVPVDRFVQANGFGPCFISVRHVLCSNSVGRAVGLGFSGRAVADSRLWNGRVFWITGEYAWGSVLITGVTIASIFTGFTSGTRGRTGCVTDTISGIGVSTAGAASTTRSWEAPGSAAASLSAGRLADQRRIL